MPGSGSQQREAAIVGIYEYPLRKVEGTTALDIKAECAKAALDDAGLKWSDVDAVYDASEGGEAGNGLSIAEYFGFSPTVIDTTMSGGSSYEYHAAHASRDIAAGKCNVALLTYGSTARMNATAIGTGGRLSSNPNPLGNMEDPWGVTLISNYGLVATRHMYQYGTTSEQLAEISVATRAHAVRNPNAVRAMEDLGFVGTGEITVQDVVESRMVADPLHLLDCCMISDGGGAVVIASRDVARGTKKKPAWIIGTGEATKYPTNDRDITRSAADISGPQAFGQAGISPSEVSMAMIYDSFTITVLTILEDLGFCKKGEGGSFVQNGRLRWDTGSLPLNTDGGGLSSNHPGMRGIFLLIEATRQLRGESTSQIKDPRIAIAHGNGGMLGSRHCAGTILLARD